MEIKINKEIRDFKEHVWGSLTMRQVIFGSAALIVGVFTYFKLDNSVYDDLRSWIVALIAVPFAVLGDFIPAVNGIPFRTYAFLWVRYRFFVPKKYAFRSESYMKAILDSTKKERERRAATNVRKTEKENRRKKRNLQHSSDCTASDSRTADLEGRHLPE